MSKSALLFLILVFTCLIQIIRIGPNWAFYLYELVYFFNPPLRWWSSALPSLPYSMIAVLLLLGSSIFASTKSKNLVSKLPIKNHIIFVIICFVFMSFFAINFTFHKEALIELIKTFIIFFLAIKALDSPAKVELAVIAYLVGATYIGYEAYSVGRNSGDRVEGIGLVDAPDSNGVSSAIVSAIPILIFYFWQIKGKAKLLVLISGALIANGLVLINSRGAFLGAAVGGVIFISGMFFYSFKVKGQKLIVIGMMFLGSLAILYIVDDSFVNRILTLTNVKDESASGSHRFRMWLSTFDMMKDHPIGLGARGFELLSPFYVDRSLFDAGQQFKAVHSTWFQALYEIGFLGFIVFILMIKKTYWMSAKLKNTIGSKKTSTNFILITL